MIFTYIDFKVWNLSFQIDCRNDNFSEQNTIDGLTIYMVNYSTLLLNYRCIL